MTSKPRIADDYEAIRQGVEALKPVVPLSQKTTPDVIWWQRYGVCWYRPISARGRLKFSLFVTNDFGNYAFGAYPPSKLEEGFKDVVVTEVALPDNCLADRGPEHYWKRDIYDGLCLSPKSGP